MRSRLASILNQTRKPHFLPVVLTSGLITGRKKINNKKGKLMNYVFKGYLFSKYKSTVHAESKLNAIIGERKPSLPTYSMTEVAKHTTKEAGMSLKEKSLIGLVFFTILCRLLARV
jgi:hypothetical protein